MDALIKSLRPANTSELKPSETKPLDVRPAELDPSEFLAAAVRPDQPRPSRSEAEAAVQTLLSYIGENPDREGFFQALDDRLELGARRGGGEAGVGALRRGPFAVDRRRERPCDFRRRRKPLDTALHHIEIARAADPARMASAAIVTRAGSPTLG